MSKLNLKLASNGTLLNMKFLPSFFAGPRALEKFVLLLRGFCQLHIPHVQFNVVSAETLRRAQAKPEEYRKATQRIFHAPGDRDLASFIEMPLVTMP